MFPPPRSNQGLVHGRWFFTDHRCGHFQIGSDLSRSLKSGRHRAGTAKIGHLNHDLVGPGRKIQSNLILVRLGPPRHPVSMNFLAIQPHHNGVIGSQEQRHHFGDLEINLAAKQLVCAGRKIERGHDTISDVDGCPIQVWLRDILCGEGRLVGVVIKWTGHFPKAHVQSEDFGLGRSSDPETSRQVGHML